MFDDASANAFIRDVLETQDLQALLVAREEAWQTVAEGMAQGMAEVTARHEETTQRTVEDATRRVAQGMAEEVTQRMAERLNHDTVVSVTSTNPPPDWVAVRKDEGPPPKKVRLIRFANRIAEGESDHDD